MNEKILIKSEPKKHSMKIPVVLMVVGIILIIISSYLTNELSHGFDGWVLLCILCVGVFSVGFIWMIVLLLAGVASKFELTVTDKRVYGVIKRFKRVDLPIDSISAVGTSIFNGIEIATSSGAIKFRFFDNRDEIHKVISELLIERQQKKGSSASNANNSSLNDADSIQQFKELYDKGIITEEEFKAKKKQLLGL